MAVKWAVANGNWSDGTTWNDGIVPAVGDYVYLDGHNINVDVAFAVETISNGTNPNTSSVGGMLVIPNTIGTLVANYEVYDTIINTSGAFDRTFVGNINLHTTSVWLQQTSLNTITINILGNITTSGAQFFVNRNSANSSYPLVINITGNCLFISTTIIGSRFNGSNSFSINGNLTLQGGAIVNGTLAMFHSVGKLANLYGRTILATNANVTGTIEYASTTGGMGIFANSLTINNPDTFTWKDITEPRSNPFIILTNAEMNNRQQYPSENEVKEGTEYVWGEKVGTYEAPPEAVVLKDYEYDTITAEENDIATYNLTRYIYADYGTLHWFELKTTTTDIVTTPSQQSISIDGETVVADTDYVVEYDDACYQWSGSAWGSITTKNIGMVKTDIVTNPTEATLCAKKGSLEVVNLPQTTLDRMANALTIDIFQQILDAHLNN